MGVSGRKDSLTLLVSLRKLMDFCPVRFEIKAVTLSMGIGEPDYSPIRQLCKEIDVECSIENTCIGKIVFEADIHVIRPLLYVEEKQIKAFIKENSIQVVHNPCTANGETKRQYIKDLLMDLSSDNKEIKNNIFGAIKRSGLDGWHE